MHDRSRVALVATTDVQSSLEIPATDEIQMEDRNHYSEQWQIEHAKQSTDLSVNSYI